MEFDFKKAYELAHSVYNLSIVAHTFCNGIKDDSEYAENILPVLYYLKQNADKLLVTFINCNDNKKPAPYDM